MKAGQTATKDGYQIALFPLDILNCTQTSGPGQYSHCCGTASDWVGSHARYPIYAPCDCVRIQQTSDNCAYRSADRVWTPLGLGYIVFGFGHDNSPPAGTTFRQGQLIGHTGTAGHVTGDHTHITQATGQTYRLINSGITCGSGNTCYYVENNQQIYNIFYITGAETIINTRGMNFQKADAAGGGGGGDDPVITDPTKFKWWMSIRQRRERRQ